MKFVVLMLKVKDNLYRVESEISVGRSFKGHSGDLTLDVQFESTAEFDHQGPGVRVSSV